MSCGSHSPHEPDGEPIPFDLKIFKHLSFSLTTPQDLEDAKRALKEVLDSVHEEGFKVDNPVTRTRAKAEFSETATPAEKLIEQQLDDLRGRLSAVERGSETGIVGTLLGNQYLGRKAVHPTFASGGSVYLIGEITFEVKVSNGAHRDILVRMQKSLPSYFSKYTVNETSESEDSFTVSVRDTERNRKNLNDFRGDFHGEECKITVLFPS